jgi:hypothetical protein
MLFVVWVKTDMSLDRLALAIVVTIVAILATLLTRRRAGLSIHARPGDPA